MATKEAAVLDLQKKFEESNAVLLTEYRGLSVTAMRTVRQAVREHATYAVAKNTLTKLAANNAGITELDEYFTGPTAVAFVSGDAVAVAKGLRDFAKANPQLVIKGGYFDGKPLDAAEVNKLAELESREVLLAKAAGAMKAKLFSAAYMFNAPATGFARAADALREKTAN